MGNLEFLQCVTETGATQTMKTNQKAELKQQIPTFLNPANQGSSTKQWNLNLFIDGDIREFKKLLRLTTATLETTSIKKCKKLVKLVLHNEDNTALQWM